MAGGRRLRQAQRVVDIADTHFAVHQQRQDPQSGSVRQRFVGLFDSIHAHERVGGHIFVLTNISQATYIRFSEYTLKETGNDRRERVVQQKYGRRRSAPARTGRHLRLRHIGLLRDRPDYLEPLR